MFHLRRVWAKTCVPRLICPLIVVMQNSLSPSQHRPVLRHPAVKRQSIFWYNQLIQFVRHQAEILVQNTGVREPTKYSESFLFSRQFASVSMLQQSHCKSAPLSQTVSFSPQIFSAEIGYHWQRHSFFLFPSLI